MSAISTMPVHNHEHDYSDLLQRVRDAFATATFNETALFTTNATGLFDLYLDSLPVERQVHNCHTCRRFIETFGGLVVINKDGSTIPVMWASPGATFYSETFGSLCGHVANARVTGVFYSKAPTWGTPKTGDWTHMAVTPPGALIYRERALTPGQAMAAKRESYRIVATALADFKSATIDEALRLLKTESLCNSERFAAPAQWLRDLQDRPKGKIGENVLWRAVALAPEGYCHPRAGVIGSLLEDIAAGMDFETVRRRFDAKLSPLMYQRPQAAPSLGNIKAAEELVKKLGIAPSLDRRFARLDELPAIWAPKAIKLSANSGVFGHLSPKGETTHARAIPAQTMTWDKFSRTVLTTAEKIEIDVPSFGSFIAITTAQNADAPPIIKWDREEERNPFGWYVYPGRSRASDWGLSSGLTEVTGIVPLPPMIGSRPMPHEGDGVIVVIAGAVDRRESGNALFPQFLKSELHGARATIEAYSRSATMGGRGEASACGYDFRKGLSIGVLIRVTVKGGTADYRIDRWD